MQMVTFRQLVVQVKYKQTAESPRANTDITCILTLYLLSIAADTLKTALITTVVSAIVCTVICALVGSRVYHRIRRRGQSRSIFTCEASVVKCD